MRLLANLDSDSPLDARRAVDRIRPVLLTVPDPVERALYVQRVARHLDIPETSIMERLRLPRRGATPFPKQESSPAARVQGHEPALLALLLQHETVLHASFSSLPTHLFTHAIDREVFRRWADAAQPAEAEDPIEVRRRELLAFRLPPLTPEQAHRAVNQNIQAITRDRAIQHQVTLSELVAEAEAELGANAVASVSLEAWLGRLPPPQQRDLAETMIEDLELGLSIHRREDLARL
jgi:DNA primase